LYNRGQIKNICTLKSYYQKDHKSNSIVLVLMSPISSAYKKVHCVMLIPPSFTEVFYIEAILGDVFF